MGKILCSLRVASLLSSSAEILSEFDSTSSISIAAAETKTMEIQMLTIQQVKIISVSYLSIYE